MFLSAACLLLALQAQGARRLSGQFLCLRFSGALSPEAVATPRGGIRPITVPVEGHCNSPLPFQFSSAPLACAALRHVSLQSQESQRGATEEGGSPGTQWWPPVALLCPGTAWRRSGEPSCSTDDRLPRGFGSYPSPFPLGVGPGRSTALPAALPARPRPRREVRSSCSALHGPAQHPAARTCCSPTAR